MNRRTRLTTVIGFIGPFVVLIAVFRGIPLVEVVRSSLQRYSLLNPSNRTFVGDDNFVRMAHDARLHNAVRATLTFALGVIVVQLPIGLGLALLVGSRRRSDRVMRTVLFVPVTLSVVVVAAIWRLILDPANGILNGALVRLGIPAQDFLINPRQALPSLLLMVTWYQVGFSMLLFHTGLQSIPAMYDEAARVDGASRWQRFRFVTLPLLRPTITFVVIVMGIFTLQQFAPAYVMTQGGPLDRTLLLIYYVYQQAFIFQDPGYASAISVAFLVAVVGINLAQRLAWRSRSTR